MTSLVSFLVGEVAPSGVIAKSQLVSQHITVPSWGQGTSQIALAPSSPFPLLWSSAPTSTPSSTTAAKYHVWLGLAATSAVRAGSQHVYLMGHLISCALESS